MKRVLAALLLACALCIPARASAPVPDVGTIAPDFTLPTPDGARVTLSSLQGEVVVLTFWAFWCDTWRDVRSGYRTLADARIPARLLAVAVDPTRRELLTQPDEAPPVFFPVLIDETRTVAERYAIDAVPTVLILDREGRITWRERGWPKPRTLLERVLEIRESRI